MPDANAKSYPPEAPAVKEINLRELHMGNAPRVVATMMKMPRCIVIVQDDAGVIQMNQFGINDAARANEMLSVAIYCNLDQHYAALRDGAGGEEAQEKQRKLDEKNGPGIASLTVAGGVQ